MPAPSPAALLIAGFDDRNAGRGQPIAPAASPSYPVGSIQAIIGNARAFLAMEANGEAFSDFVWSFVDNQPQITHAATLAEIPTTTPASDALSKALKKRGFKFVGSTICYSFMQACGLVNDRSSAAPGIRPG